MAHKYPAGLYNHLKVNEPSLLAKGLNSLGLSRAGLEVSQHHPRQPQVTR